MLSRGDGGKHQATSWLIAVFAAVMMACLVVLSGCRPPVGRDDRTVVVLIESSPNNLDPRVGTDAQSERLDGLIFDALVKKDEHFAMQPWLASSWEQPTELQWIFHLRQGVQFQDGRPLEAADVVWTINSMRDGTLITAKGGAFAAVRTISARDASTVVIELKRADASLLFNLSDGQFGVVPRGAGREFGQRPVGTGAFQFVQALADREVVLERAARYWADKAGVSPRAIQRLRFAVIPDTVTAALELKKGSADVAVNVVTLDMVKTLEATPGLAVERGPGAPVMYLNFNTAAGPLHDTRVRQAIACAMDRQAIVDALWRGHARLADTLLPPGHWAEAQGLPRCEHDVPRAIALLDAAGMKAGRDGVRLRLEMKTSTDETTRLLAVILQQQLRAAGIVLTVRSAEFGTFYSDVTRGAFQMYALRWIGVNEDPDIFRYAFATSQFPPQGGNRGRYSSIRLDDLLKAATETTDLAKRKDQYQEIQRLLADEVPAVPLWFPENNVVHTRRVAGVVPSVNGDFSFLRTAELQ